MKDSQSKSISTLAVLSGIVAFYGISIGALGIPIGLFVGPHILFAAGIHLALGTAFLIAAFGIENERSWAFWLATISSATIVVLRTAAVAQSLAPPKWENILVWSFITTFFAGMAFATNRLGRSLAMSESMRLN